MYAVLISVILLLLLVVVVAVVIQHYAHLFTVIYLKQSMFLGYTVLQLFYR